MKNTMNALALLGFLILTGCDLPGVVGLDNPVDPSSPSGQVLANTVAAPIFNPPAGTYGNDQGITITSSTANAKIYYTTDGTTPTVESTLVSGLVLVAGDQTNVTIKAIAVKAGMTSSTVTSAGYRIKYPNFSASTGDGTVSLSWPAVLGATGYNLYFSEGTTATTSSTKWSGATLTTTDATITGLNNGVQYAFVYAAVVGSTIGTPSAVATATPGTTPTQVTAEASGTSVTVSWTPVTGATGYNIYWATGTTATTSSTKASTVGNATSATITGLSPGTQYSFVVTDINGIESAASGVVTVLLVPARPSSLSAASTASSLTMTWPSMPGVTSYNLYWSTSPTMTTATGTKVPGVQSGYVLSGLSAAT
ncbi:MAG: fibronectin type III domain-containing protein, partial [Mariniphaga sp.]